MDTSLEHVHEHAHEHVLEPHVKVARARAGVLMLILSDALAVLATFAAGGYLSVLNTEGNFKVAGDFAPAFLPGLLVTIASVLSGILYLWWERSGRRSESGGGPAVVFVLSWLLLLAGGVVDVWLGSNLKYGIPISAYESVQLLIIWSTGIHFLLTALIGLLLLGRVLRGRLRIDGIPFVPEVVGYWWYYTIIAGVLMWIFGVFLS
jgi:hypothetical protein